MATSLSIQLLQLLISESMLDNLDLEILESRLMSFENPKSSSLGLLAYFAIVSVAIADGSLGFYPMMFILLSPLAFIVLIKALKGLCYRSASSYICALAEFDSVFRRVVTSLRSREIALCRLRADHYLEINKCLRPLRCRLLEMLRCEVQSLIVLLKRICWDSDSEILLCNLFTPEMSDLALNDHVENEFLELSSLKELWNLLFLLRSEFFRYFLLHLSQPSYKLIPIFLHVIRKTAQITDIKIRLSSELESFAREEDRSVENDHYIVPTRIGKVRAYLSFASEVLDENGLVEEEKFRRISRILEQGLELLIPSSHLEPPGVNDHNEPPGVNDHNELPGVSDHNEPPGVNDYNEPPGVNDHNEPPGVSDHNEPPGVSDHNEPPGVSDHSEPLVPVPEAMESSIQDPPLPLPNQSDVSRQVFPKSATESNENGGFIFNRTEEVYEGTSIASDEMVLNGPPPLPEEVNQPSEDAKLVIEELKAYFRRKHIGLGEAGLNVRVRERTIAASEQDNGREDQHGQQGGENGSSGDAQQDQNINIAERQEESNNESRNDELQSSAGGNSSSLIPNAPRNGDSGDL